LIREKIEVPGYFPLADQILSAIKTQNQTLAATIERTLDSETRAILDGLLTQEPLAGDTIPGKTSAYKLTLMKRLSQSTKPSKVRERVADLDLVRGLYHQLSPALQAIALKPGGIQYYAHSVIRSRSFSLCAEAIPSGIYTFSPLLLTSITGSKTTWSMCRSPANEAFRMGRSASTRNNVTPAASS
jgi:hypothetical protein